MAIRNALGPFQDAASGWDKIAVDSVQSTGSSADIAPGDVTSHVAAAGGMAVLQAQQMVDPVLAAPPSPRLLGEVISPGTTELSLLSPTQSAPAQLDIRVQAYRPVVFNMVRLLKGVVPSCTAYALPGGKAGWFATLDDPAFPDILVGRSYLVVLGAGGVIGRMAEVGPAPDYLVQLPYPDAPIVNAMTWQVPPGGQAPYVPTTGTDDPSSP